MKVGKKKFPMILNDAYKKFHLPGHWCYYDGSHDEITCHNHVLLILIATASLTSKKYGNRKKDSLSDSTQSVKGIGKIKPNDKTSTRSPGIDFHPHFHIRNENYFIYVSLLANKQNNTKRKSDYYLSIYFFDWHSAVQLLRSNETEKSTLKEKNTTRNEKLNSRQTKSIQ